MQSKSNDALVHSAFQTVNQAIEHNRKALFFRTLLKACESFTPSDSMTVGIYPIEVDSSIAYYQFVMEDGKFTSLERIDSCEDVDWKVSEDYLRDLAEQPEKYIKHPQKLSLNWLVNRVTKITA